MHKALFALLLLSGASVAAAQPVAPGRWDVTSTVLELSAPGVPGFLLRMMRGKSKAEHKRVPAGQGIEALIAPDPKARCTIDSQRVASGQYAQTLRCPQKQGAPIHVVRAGTYDGSGFVGRATMNGTSPKGPMSVVLSQRAVRIGD